MIPLNSDTIAQLVKYDTMILVFLLILAFSYLRKLKLSIENAASRDEVDKRFASVDKSLKDLEINLKTEMRIITERADLSNSKLEERFNIHELFITNKIMELANK